MDKVPNMWYHDSTMEQDNESLGSMLNRLKNSELSQKEELALLKELNFSYDVLNMLLEEIKVAKLSNDIKKI